MQLGKRRAVLVLLFQRAGSRPERGCIMLALEFSRRARVRQTPISTQRRYVSDDGRYALVEVRGVLGRYWLAIRRLYSGEYVISQHRKRSGAEGACAEDRQRSLAE